MERKRNSTAWQHPSKWRSRSSSRSRSSTLQNSAIGMETSRSTWPSIGKQRSHHNNTERVPKQWMRTHASRFSFRWNLTGEIHTPTPTPSLGVQSPTKVVWIMFVPYYDLIPTRVSYVRTIPLRVSTWSMSESNKNNFYFSIGRNEFYSYYSHSSNIFYSNYVFTLSLGSFLHVCLLKIKNK